MSGSRDKQRRKHKRDDGFDLRKNDKDLEAAEKRRKQTRTAIITIIAIAIVAVIVLVINSNLFYRNAPALRVDNQSFSIADMNFYAAQTQTGLFEEAAGMAQRSAILHRGAVEEGLSISADEQAGVESTLDYMRENYANYANPATGLPFESAGNFIVANFGRAMNMRTLRDRLEFEALGRTFQAHFLDTRIGEYTPEELEDFYVENRDNFDRVQYRVFELPFASGEETDAEDLMTKEEAQAIAEIVMEAAEEDGEAGFLSAIEAETGQENLEERTIRDELRSTPAFFFFGDWVLANNRAPGDFTSMEVEEDGIYAIYVLYFLGEEDNRYYAGNVRHILIRPEAEEIALFDEEGNPLDEDAWFAAEAEAEEAAREVAGARATEILNQWRNGAATEESFIELVREYSADYREEADPGFFGDIDRQANLVEPFRDWAVAENRRPGDVEIVETQFGYHIMYFVSHSEMSHRHTLAARDMSQTAFGEWMEERLEASNWQRALFARLTSAIS